MSDILLNGSGRRALNENQQACVDLLEETLSEARAGNVSSVAVIVCMKNGYASVLAGSNAADLNLGCDSIKRKILAAVEDDGNRKRKSGIVTAGMR